MNILITAGGTSEKIDDVRHLTNHATGRLGQKIADALQHDDLSIHYVYGPQAVLPKPTGEADIFFYPIQSVTDLYQTMKKILTEKKIDYVIHSMAVSDYQLSHLANEEILANTVAEHLTEKKWESKDELSAIIKQTLKNKHFFPKSQAKKIDSAGEELILFLDKAPKVIHSIKKWQPETILIGFKLLVGVSEKELYDAAQASIKKNQADYILANDLESITDQQHTGLLINSSGIIDRFSTKQAIADGLRQLILTQGGN
ncbi:phosphopantothenoylcysteine decarboxylase domain-containing protein [Vagococcus vulneris]|uniref:DNA/pantothenate metabolism flavoprotein C-terminal domain-containing protein n=1 Tax=Vagococcus vulneris TaxID=1977869 RepID=A0A429ZY73_9ENTE|nr:phosphopantothenoylcysteine decarboxylase [Vagococcus vulneris]RST98902.1 hypothetical protein CBF37_05895 [Vagococcus vulneris]